MDDYDDPDDGGGWTLFLSLVILLAVIGLALYMMASCAVGVIAGL